MFENGKSACMVTEVSVPGEYVSVKILFWLLKQGDLNSIFLFGYKGMSAWLQRHECLVNTQFNSMQT